ncbi:MAG: hypothetical protein GY845_28640 [Planctomycetes bacterium]|nr:hypothetical protein [Planctomycetota bacterium]
MPPDKKHMIAVTLWLRRLRYTQQQIHDKLTRWFGEANTPHINTISNWERDYADDTDINMIIEYFDLRLDSEELRNFRNQANEIDFESIIWDLPGKFFTVHNGGQEEEGEESQEFDPPSVRNLVDERNIPESVALQVIVFWDHAVINNQHGIKSITKHLVDVLADDPQMPFRTATNIAYTLYKADQSQDAHLVQVCDIARRYRPWRGGNNRKAFDTTISKLYPPATTKVNTNVPITGIPFIKMNANVYCIQLDDGRWIAIALAPTSITGLKLSKQNLGEVLIPLTATEAESKKEAIDKIKQACKRLLLPVPYDDRKRAKTYAKEYFGINTMPLEKPTKEDEQHTKEEE